MSYSRLLRIFLHCYFIISAVSGNPMATQCKRVDGEPTCVCETDDGSIISLMKIAHEDKKPSITITYETFEFSLNPCYGVNLDVKSGLCMGKDGSVGCQQETGTDNSWGIGLISSETIYHNGDGTYFVTYINGQDSRHTKINLICEESVSTPEVTTESDKGHSLEYVFNLTSKHVCPNKKSSGSSGSSIGVGPIGIVVILLAFIGFGTYIIVGIVINMLAFHKTGSDVIPQKQLWFGLPFLIKDGVMFTLYPLIRLVKKDYQQLE